MANLPIMPYNEAFIDTKNLKINDTWVRWLYQVNTNFNNLVTGVAGGDLSGSYPNPTVATINGKAITLSGTFTTSGAFNTTLTVTANTNVTLPTSGTLVNGGGSCSGACSGTNTGDQTNISGNAATVTTNANLTGDVTSVGNAATLKTVNSSVGSYTNASITVNAKGLITAASTGSAGGVTATSFTTGVAGVPMFSAYNSTSTTLTANANTKVQFQTTEFDLGTYFDNTTNYRYTPLVAGIYHVVGQVFTTITNVVSTTQYNCILYINGSAYRYGTSNLDSTTVGACSILDTYVSLNGSTDYIELYFRNGNAANNLSTNNSQLVTFFSAAWIGPNT